MSIHPRDILFYGGGAALERYGTLTRRVASLSRRGEDVVETFTRSGVGYYLDRDGVLRQAATDVPRVEWVDADGDGVREPYLLLEDARTNLLLRSEELDNASWTKTNCTVAANAGSAADGATTADRLTATGAGDIAHTVEQTITSLSTEDVAFSIYAKKQTGADHVYLEIVSGSDWYRVFFNVLAGTVGSADVSGVNVTYQTNALQALGGGWYRCMIACNVLGASTTCTLRAGMATADNDTTFSQSSETMDLWGASCENALFWSSYIKTTSASATRNAETLSCPFPAGPNDPHWCYLRFLERMGPTWAAGTSIRLVHLGKSDSSGPKLEVHRVASTDDYLWRYGGSTVDSTSTLTTIAPALGDDIELLGVGSAGVATLHGVKNGGAQITATAGSAITVPTSWSDTLLYLNSRASAEVGFVALRAVILGRGSAPSFADLRALLP